MNICIYCGRFGRCGKRRPCPSPRHPDNRIAAQARRKVIAAESIADRHAAEFIDTVDETGESLHIHIHAAITDAVLDAWGAKA